MLSQQYWPGRPRSVRMLEPREAGSPYWIRSRQRVAEPDAWSRVSGIPSGCDCDGQGWRGMLHFAASVMIDSILANFFVNQWVVFGVVTLVLLVLAEVGRRLGLASRQHNPEATTGHSGSVQGAVLGLLGLLLGFSFAMAVGRHDARRNLVVEEANAIGTTWLRAGFLPGPHAQEVKDLSA